MTNPTNDRINEILKFCAGHFGTTERYKDHSPKARQAIEKLLIEARMDELEHANSNVKSQEYPFSVPRPPTWPMYADNRMNFLKDQLNTLEGKS